MDLFGDLPDPGDDKASKSSSVRTEDNSSSEGTTNVNAIETQKLQGKRKSLEDRSDAPEDKKNKPESAADIFKLKGFVADRQGEREEMQDAHTIVDDFLPTLHNVHPSIHRLSLYCVFDGHGGLRASRFASQHLHNNLRDKFPKGLELMDERFERNPLGIILEHTSDVGQVEKEIKKAFIDAFKKTDEDFLKEATKTKPSWKDGSTAVAVLAINNTLYIANLGDSKAVLCRYKENEGKYIGVSLTSDHNPSVYEERMRIQKAGGWVRDGRVMGQLEVARSIGDGPYKNHGVTCVPDVKRCQLTVHDRFVIIACDGLWKSFTVDESVQFANSTLEDKNIESTGKKTAREMQFETACNKLASSAVLKLSGDNVTVLIVSIEKQEGKT